MDSRFSPTRGLSDIVRVQFEDHLLRKWFPRIPDATRPGMHARRARVEEIWDEQALSSLPALTWTATKAAGFVRHGNPYERYARAAARLLEDRLWDSECGGFFRVACLAGEATETGRGTKLTRENALAIKALAAFHSLTNDPAALTFSVKALEWLEEHALDPHSREYHEVLSREGTPLPPSSAAPSAEAGVAVHDAHSTDQLICLLEAYAEIGSEVDDATLRERQIQRFRTIRDSMVTATGALQREHRHASVPAGSVKGSFDDHPGADRVLFGHECLVATLLLEVSHELGLEDDPRTLSVAKRLLEHALQNGWDHQRGGLFDSGRILKGPERCIADGGTKSSWVQAECLNALLLFSRVFPQDNCYRELFEKQWEYIDTYVIEHHRGGWRDGGADVAAGSFNPWTLQRPASPAHEAKALMNCIALLEDDPRGMIRKRQQDLQELIHHWKST